jgi:PQQ-dependent dehydrogenase (methanol/ethanol family)
MLGIPALASDADWQYYNHAPTGERFSSLSDINDHNVGGLQQICRVRVSGPGPFSSSITMINGTLYVTSTLSTIALDASNCDVLWKSNYTLQDRQVYNSNRGVGYADGVVVRGTPDARLIAYDALSGQERWRARVGDPNSGEFVSAAPQIWNGKVFAGIAGSDWGIRGRVMAFNLETGAQLWSFNTVPGPGEPGSESWPADSWKRGGGGLWTAFTLDPATAELFVPVGNPAMSWNGDDRKGANLYTNSVLVLDANTGKYRWHYQLIAHDTHDYDMSSPPMLATLADGRRIIAITPKDGFLSVLDRHTHALMYKVAATTILNQQQDPSAQGVRSCPGMFGGSEWNGPAFDSLNQHVLTGQTDWCSTVKLTVPAPDYIAGNLYMGGIPIMDQRGGGWVTAFDAPTGQVRWRYRTPAPITSGVTPTAGNITFLGDMAGALYAFRSSDGKVLKKIETGGSMAGGLITYKMDGRQFVAITSGNISRSNWLGASGLPTVVIYALPQTGNASLDELSANQAKGQQLYESICSSCHGEHFVGGAGAPTLSNIKGRYSYEALVRFIKHPKSPMPRLYPSTLSEQDVRDVARFVLDSP